jgi:hypothetical protein
VNSRKEGKKEGRRERGKPDGGGSRCLGHNTSRERTSSRKKKRRDENTAALAGAAFNVFSQPASDG